MLYQMYLNVYMRNVIKYPEYYIDYPPFLKRIMIF